MKRRRKITLTLCCALAIPVGLLTKAKLDAKPFACTYATTRWVGVGLPTPGGTSLAFERALTNVVAGVGASFWSENLNCSNNESEVGRLFKHYLEQNPKQLNLLALDVAALARSERRQTKYAKAERLKKIFGREDVAAYFSWTAIDDGVGRLRSGQVGYSEAVFSIVEKSLNDTEKGQFQILILSLDR